MKHDDFLVEIHTEELPPKSLLKLGEVFAKQVKERLEKSSLTFADVKFYATPRRLAVYVKDLSAQQEDQLVERRGPALSAAFDAEGKPTPACAGFAKSCGVTPAELQTIQTPQGEWLGYTQKVTGKTVAALLPDIIASSLQALPIAKRMRWGSVETEFVRPVLSVLMLFGDHIIKANMLGCDTGNVTYGHRFMAPKKMAVPHASSYVSLLKREGFVLADFSERREAIQKGAIACVTNDVGAGYAPLFDVELLDEVTGLVEWPTPLCGCFDEPFLALPREVLISSMQDHQRYFPVIDAKGKLSARFVTISNIQSKNKERVIQGNERVLRARLSDAAFFYAEDKKESLAKRIERLRHIIFQAKLGTLYEKAERLSMLAVFMAKKRQMNVDYASRAGLLAKTDLTTNMVNEFPELQGVMGGYYALHDHEPKEVVDAIIEQYLPAFAGDQVPDSPLGEVLALSDKLDTLVGAFGIHQIPTGDKDPYGLRRASIGVLRILIEKRIDIDLRELLQHAIICYGNKLTNDAALTQLLAFMQERLRAWYQEQGVTADIFASVAALQLTNPLDMHKRIQAVQVFKALSEAETLSIANKRVSNILSGYKDKLEASVINPAFFEHDVEKELVRQLDAKSTVVKRLYADGQYNEVLLQLSELRQPIDDFFDQVMVMTEHKATRENRILMLSQLRSLFLQVADIALLQ